MILCNEKQFTYILLCNDNTFYIGYTNNLYLRILKHNLKKASKYTRGRTPVKLVYYDEFKTKSEALKNEFILKKYTKKQKIKYIALNMTSEKNMLIKKINEENKL